VVKIKNQWVKIHELLKGGFIQKWQGLRDKPVNCKNSLSTTYKRTEKSNEIMQDLNSS